MTATNQIPFNTLIAALLDESTPFPPRYLRRFTDLPLTEQNLLADAWPHIAGWRRKALLEDLDELNVSDTILSFESVCQVALGDSEAVVRKLAVQMLNEYENPDQIPTYLRLAKEDPDSEVRAAIASVLGAYIYQGELEKISKSKQKVVEDCLLGLTQGADEPLVRRRALEALGYSGRAEVTPLIEQAYTSGKREWLVSALYAMGRSANEIWREKILGMLDNEWPTVRAEAVAAAGELGLKEASPQLMKLIDDDDDRVRTAAVWALSQIGGDRVRALLEDLMEQVEDDDEAEFLEEALENLSFTEDENLFSIDFDDDDADEDDDA